MISFRYAALALLVTGAPAMAQNLLDYAPYVALPGEASQSRILRDSIIYDTGDNSAQFTIGYGFPGGSATPTDPDEARAFQYVAVVKFDVPANRTTPFALTGMRIRYRTSTASGPASTPPRVRYDADAPPIVSVFPGDAPIVVAFGDSTSAVGNVFQGDMPYSTALGAPSTVDGYRAPITQQFLVSFIPTGQTTVPPGLIFQPGQSFSIRVQFFNVPFPMQIEAGSSAAVTGHSLSAPNSGLASYGPIDIVQFNGLNVADTPAADGIEDNWFIRALSDDAFTTAGEDEAANRAVALGRPTPNPAQGMVELPFALRDAGTARISVYDVTGREVALVADRTFGSGGQSAAFDASRLAAGVYVVVLEANGERATQRLSVVR